MATCSLFDTLEDFRRIAVEFCEDLAATGVRYAEAVFSPATTRVGSTTTGTDRSRRCSTVWRPGAREHGVSVRLCPDIVRDMGLGRGGAHARCRAPLRRAPASSR